MNIHRALLPFGEEPLGVETGRLMKQADAAIVCNVGGTVLLVAVTVGDPKPDRDFFPLMVDYREKFYAGGRIPGGFFKREGRPGDMETLRARITDRAIRPLFPNGMRNEVMVYITIVSSDGEHPAEIAALNATSLALRISSIPFPTSTGAVRVARIGGKLMLNPTFAQMKESDLDLIIAGTRNAINMVESGASELNEEEMIAALKFGHEGIVKIIEEMEKFTAAAGKAKFEFVKPTLPADVQAKVEQLAAGRCAELCGKPTSKEEFSDTEHAIIKETAAAFAESHPDLVGLVKEETTEVLSRAVRKLIIETGKRVDGRDKTTIRPISCEAPILPATHGSALFTRGQTQALGVVTLGTIGEAQMIDTMLGTYDKFFLLQYNFPPFSVGEAKPMRAAGRREIGHGALAERALEPMIPKKDDFPYTVRVVAEILESNGSSSMATVCVSSLALMDAGVPLKKPVAGIAMGLVADEQGRMAVLTDIQGVEDHLGDMDFKVAGTRDGITALQMDIKIEGVTFEIMEQALHQAKDARLFILGKMAEVLGEHRSEMASNAPRVTTVQIPVDKIGALIGPGGKNIRGIIERTGAKIDVEDDGKVFISATTGTASAAAEAEVRALTTEVVVGQVYEGKVVRITDFGAFVELTPGKDGMVHVSELGLDRVEHVEDVAQMGKLLKVKVINVDPMGKVRLSHKAVLAEAAGLEYDMDAAQPRGGAGGGRGGRGGFGGGGGGRGGDRDRGGDRGRGPDRGGDRGRGDRPYRGDRPEGGGDRPPQGGGAPREYGFRERPREDKSE